MMRVPLDALTFSNEQIYGLDGVPFTGVAYETFDSGSLMNETSFTDGVKNGPEKTWSENGQLIETTEIWHGALHGQSITWSTTGQQRTKRWYEFGVETARTIYETDGTEQTWRLPLNAPARGMIRLHRERYVNAPRVPAI